MSWFHYIIIVGKYIIPLLIKARGYGWWLRCPRVVAEYRKAVGLYNLILIQR